MKLCIVFNPEDSKLQHNSYCSVFRDMFEALAAKFNCRQFVTSDCNADEIDADVIFFFDPHSTHHVKIDDIKAHRALKIEFWNDLHQEAQTVKHRVTGKVLRKLGAEERVRRLEERGIDFVCTTVRDEFPRRFDKLLGNAAEEMQLYFPHAPKRFVPKSDFRKVAVLANGATWGADEAYDFRAWAYKNPMVEHVEHTVKNAETPAGDSYMDFLSGYGAALALCSTFPVPKYFEIPAAGCLVIAQRIKEYEDLGFRNGVSCIYVDRQNFDLVVKDYLRNPRNYVDIAATGKRLVDENYTAEHFANYIYSKAFSWKLRGQAGAAKAGNDIG